MYMLLEKEKSLHEDVCNLQTLLLQAHRAGIKASPLILKVMETTEEPLATLFNQGVATQLTMTVKLIFHRNGSSVVEGSLMLKQPRS